jgi:hypothetical protein
MENIRERRKHRRLNIQLPLHIRGTDRYGRSVDISSVTDNVSTGGAYFSSSELVEPGNKIDIFISIPYEISQIFPPRTLKTEALIIRVIEPGDKSQNQKGIAIEFLKDLKWNR